MEEEKVSEVRVEQVSKRFGGLLALNRVSLEARSGERRAIIGPNGAGKTTLFRIISGEMSPTEGQVYLGSKRIDGTPPEHLARSGLARTFQHSSIFPELSLAENLTLSALAARGQTHRLSRMQLEKKVFEVLAQVGLEDKAHQPAADLSHGEKRQLEIGLALAQNTRVLLLDEPLAGLAGAERRHMAELIARLPQQLTLLLIEHNLDFALGLAHQVSVLHYGELLAEGQPDAVVKDPKVQEVYVGQAASAQINPKDRPQKPVLLRVKGLKAGYGGALVLEGVDLEVRQGEVVALLGRNGMGKTTLIHTLMGLMHPMGGEVRLEQQEITSLPPQSRAALGISLVPQGRRMLSELLVEEELILAQRPGPWSIEKIYQLFPRLEERGRFYSTSLSGGEQQMLALSRALVANPRLVLMDEPSEGLSPLMVKHVGEIIHELRQSGETILLAEQNVDLALGVADYVYILEHGQLVFEGTPGQILQQRHRLQEYLGVGKEEARL